MSNSPVPSYPNTPGWSRWIERLRAVTAGRFTIIRELGRGGFAAVFLAQQHQPNRRVAIKLLLPTHTESQWALEHFRGESQKISEWRHQSVVTIYEVHEVEDLFFFVMSYVEGASLHDIIQTLGPLSVQATRSILSQMGSALQYAHRQGVTHRDIKPQNVLVDTDGGAVVTDFGISKQSGGTSHTVTGMLFGTPPYMAPEQCESGATSIASDQYALGIVAYEMLTGTPPFTGHVTTVLMKHLMEPVPPISSVRSDVPEDLEAAILKMLAKKPEDRFASISEAMQAAGAAELPDYHPERRRLADAARETSTCSHASVVDILSIPPRIEVGERISIEATARTLTGDAISFGETQWTVDNSRVANLDAATGTLTAMHEGVATLMVKSGGIEQTIRVDVVPPKVAVVQVTPPTAPLRIGQRAHVVATAKSKHGVPVAAPTRWTSDQPSLVSVAGDGTLLAHGAGRARICAQVDEITSEFWVEVAEPRVSEVRITGAPGTLTVGDRRQLSVVVLDESDHLMTDRVVQWSSSNRSIATVSSSGLVTTSAAGKVTITAVVDDRSAAQVIDVEAAPVVVVEIQKAQSAVTTGDRVRLRAIGRDATGNAVDKPVTWSSSDAAVARVEADGMVSALAPGNVRLSAMIDGVTASTTLDIEAATVIAPRLSVSHAPAEPPPRAASPPAPVSPARDDSPRAGKGMLIGGGVLAAAAVVAFLATRGKPGTEATTTSPSAVANKPDSIVSAPPAATPPVTPEQKSAEPQRNVAANRDTTSASTGRASGVSRRISASVPRRALAVGDSMAVNATMSDGSAPSALQWTSSDRSKATVTPQGLVRGAGEGSVVLMVRSGALRDSVRIDITPRVVAQPTTPVQQATSNTPPPVVAPPKDSTPPATGRANEPPASRPSENAAAENSVRSLVNDFAVALTSRKIDDVVKLYPTMPKKDQDNWKGLFGYLKDFKASYRVENVSVSNGTATVRAAGQHTYTNPDTKKSCALPVTVDMTASETPRGWRVTAFTQDTKQRC